MANWKQKYRQIGGERRLVKIQKKSDGSERVRVVGNRNTTDANTKNPRKKNYYSSTDAGATKHRIKRRSIV